MHDGRNEDINRELLKEGISFKATLQCYRDPRKKWNSLCEEKSSMNLFRSCVSDNIGCSVWADGLIQFDMNLLLV